MKKRIKRHYRIARYVFYRETLLAPVDHFWTFIGTFIAIASIGLLQQANFTQQDSVFLIGSFGASCVLIFGATNSPLAQPRNLIGGHLLASIIGVAIHKLFPDQLWLSSALAVSLSIVCMQITKTMHPPAGATALIANIGSEKITSLGFGYTITPVMTGVMILFITALLVNNISPRRSYPVKPLPLVQFFKSRISYVFRQSPSKLGRKQKGRLQQELRN
jgi:CBS-domain-containing membrane protein